MINLFDDMAVIVKSCNWLKNNKLINLVVKFFFTLNAKCMDFNEIIEGLHSTNVHKICNVLNTAFHISKLSYTEGILGIHTGFYCKVQTKTLFSFIYAIEQKQLFFQGTRNAPLSYLAIGCPMISGMGRPEFCDEAMKFRSKYSLNNRKWYTSYDIANNEFQLTPLISGEVVNQHELSFTKDDGSVLSLFTIYNGDCINAEYQYLTHPNIKELYKGNGRFAVSRQVIVPLSNRNENGNWDCDSQDDEPCDRKYNNIYGLSDDFIDDVLGGVPDAYWNID